MIEEFSHKGEWFIPSNPDVKVHGVLKFDTKSDPILELFGTLIDRDNFGMEIDLIVGTTTTGEFITLYNSVEEKRENTNGNQASTYSSHYVFFGCHFHRMDALNFTKISADFKNINKWVQKYGFRINNDFEKNSVNVSYQKPDDISFKLNDNLSGNFKFRYFYPWYEKTNIAHLNQYVSFCLESSEPLSFDLMLDNLMLFQNFLTLACMEPAYPTSINTITTIKDNGDEISCLLVYKPGFSYIKPIRGREKFLFNFTEIEKNFEVIIKKWYELADKIEPVTNLLFNSFYNEEKSFENKFLNMAQALETYHRKFKDSKPFNETEFENWKTNLVDSITDPSYKDMLNNKLTYANEQPLRKRLNTLIDNLQIDIITKIVGTKKNFVNSFVDTRNYYTHYDLKLKDKALTGNELYQMTQKLKVILIATVLMETGITNDELNEIFKKNASLHFNHLIKN